MRLSALLRLFSLLLLVGTFAPKAAGQSVKNYTYPLYATAMELDTDRVTYAKHKITQRTDSIWEKGKLLEWSVANYAANGNIIRYCTYPQDEPGKEEIILYEYNAANICVKSRHINVLKGDTTYMLEKRSTGMDTARGRYSFETKVTFTEGRPDTTYSDFEWDYIDTKSRKVWARLYTNRTIQQVEQKPGNDTIRGTIIEFHDKDTLSKLIFMTGANLYSVDTHYTYLRPGLIARAVFVNNRSTETRAWENGKLIEHLVYVDSVSDYRIWKSTVYNMLKNDSVPEIVITMSDSVNIVRKNGMNVFEDYQPDTVEYNPLPPPMMPEPTFEEMFPYRKKVPMEDGMHKLEYYNFRAGTIKPLLVIIRDNRGVVHFYYYGDIVWKREVQ